MEWDEFLPEELAKEIDTWFLNWKNFKKSGYFQKFTPKRESSEDCITYFCGCLPEGLWSSGAYEIRI